MSRKILWIAALLVAALLLVVLRPPQSPELSRALEPTSGPAPRNIPATLSTNAPLSAAPVGLAQPDRTAATTLHALHERLDIRGTLYSSDERLTPAGRRSRVRIVDSDFHHPLVRLEETVDRDPRLDRDQVVHTVAMVADHVLVKVRTGETFTSIADRAAALGLAVRKVVEAPRTVALAFAMRGDDLPTRLIQLRAAPWVETAQPDYLYAADLAPNDELYQLGGQWSLHHPGMAGPGSDQDINAPEAWNIVTSAADVIVAVIDTGVRLTHEDLAGNLWRNPGESGAGREANGLDDDGNGYVDDVFGLNAITPDRAPADDVGHGTHVAGTIGATGNNGRGIAGVAWRTQLMALKFLNASGLGADSDAIACINYARQKGAHILNLSWGGEGDSELLEQALAAASAAGITIVAAAGNSALDVQEVPHFPASYSLPGMVTIGSIDVDGSYSSFSNRGPIHLSAPGERIFSTDLASDTDYSIRSGTSMAAPHVAGAAALLRQVFSAATNVQLVDRLIAGGADSARLRNRTFSGRRLDLFGSLSLANPGVPPRIEMPAPISRRTDETLTLTANVTGDAPLTYQWQHEGNDIPGANAATLVVPSVGLGDAGRYTLVVTNPVATMRSRFVPVTVTQPPTILVQPISQQVTAGDDVMLRVAAAANGGQLKYQWHFNGNPWPGATADVLRLLKVKVANAGQYVAVVTTEFGSTSSAPAILTVEPLQPPVIVTQPSDQMVDPDTTVSFSVAATGSNPITIEWFKDGVVLPGATQSSLYLYRVQASDSGLYTARLSNSAGTMDSRAARLVVRVAQAAPFFLTEPSNHHAFTGEKVILSAVAKGTPPPTFQWYRNGVAIPGAQGPDLEIPQIIEAQAGDYTVTASNDAGSVTSSPARVTVEPDFGIQQWEWRNPLPQGNYLTDVTYLGRSFVAIGAGGGVMTSPDGVAWTIRPGASQQHLHALVTNGQTLVAVGAHGEIVVSEDEGATWTKRISGVNRDLMDVAYGNGLYIAVGWDGTIVTSRDLKTWSPRTVGVYPWLSVTFGTGTFVIGGQNGQFMTSGDGTNWATHSTPYRFHSLNFANGLFFAGGSRMGNGNMVGELLTATDGMSWQSRFTGNSSVGDVIHSAGTYLAVEVDGDLLASVNGTDWTMRGGSTGYNYVGALAHNGQTWVMVGESGFIRTSPDSLNWTTRAGGSTASIESVAYGPPGFVATGMRSRDGVLWTRVPEMPYGNQIIYTDRYVMVATTDVATSTDGRSWERIPVPESFRLTSIARGAGLYVAVDQEKKIFTSSDLRTWTRRTVAATEGFTRVAYGGGQFVVVGRKGTIFTSPNGITWTARHSGLPLTNENDLWGAAHNGERWVAVGPTTTLLHSPDGVTWNHIANTSTKWVMTITHVAGHFVAGTMNGTLLTSVDGLTWTERPTLTTSNIYGIAQGAGSFVVVGHHETILQSRGFSQSQPGLTPSPARQTVAVGQTASLRVEAVGTIGQTYQWLKNGRAISGATDPVLTLPAAQFGDAGEYAVTITSSTGSTTSNPAPVAVVGATFNPAGFDSTGGIGGIHIAAPPTLSWTAGPADSWLTIVSGETGAGDGDVHFRVPSNPTQEGRRSAIVVAGRALEVVQSAAGVAVQPASQAVGLSGTATFAASVTGGGTAPLTYNWYRDGELIGSGGGSSLSITDVNPEDSGLYFAAVGAAGTTVNTVPAILGVEITEKLMGGGREVGSDIEHPNGNIYDQVLLEGGAVTLTANPGQVTRVSFVDLSDDIVQVEFSGAGALTVRMDAPPGPAAPAKYNQPTIQYVKGHASVVISGADESTHVSIFSVGRANAVNQSLFRNDVAYDGFADIGYLAILSRNGKFGGVRAGNTHFWNSDGVTGIHAPGVEFTGPVFVGDITAFGTATPALTLGNSSDVWITGGSLEQANGRAVQMSGVNELVFKPGMNSGGLVLPAQPNGAQIEERAR